MKYVNLVGLPASLVVFANPSDSSQNALLREPSKASRTYWGGRPVCSCDSAPSGVSSPDAQPAEAAAAHEATAERRRTRRERIIEWWPPDQRTLEHRVCQAFNLPLSERRSA